MLRTAFVSLVLLIGFMFPVSNVAAAEKEIYTGTLSSLAVSGYDPVGYFREGKPVKGNGQYTTKWKGATWQFSSAENRDSFQASPDKFAPQYGGYCAWAVSQGYTASADPEAWHVENGKLYLNYSDSVQARWKQDIAGHIAKGDRNWPKVVE